MVIPLKNVDISAKILYTKGMTIKQLAYFIGIVQADCNLSAASLQLNISQPALSTLIKRIEREEGIDLFYRQSGRFQGLTPSGEIFYEHAQGLVAHYDTMQKALRASATEYRGPLRIGLPPMSLSMSFARTLSKLKTDHPKVKVEVVELGAEILRKSLATGALDFALLITPTGLAPGLADEYSLQKATLAAFMHESHPLAQQKKIAWRDLDGYPLAIFDETFMIHHQLMNRFKTLGLVLNIQIQSAYWDYMLMSTHDSPFITILPSPVSSVISQPGTIMLEFDQPLLWEVILCHRKKASYSQVEKEALASLLSLRLFDKGL